MFKRKFVSRNIHPLNLYYGRSKISKRWMQNPEHCKTLPSPTFVLDYRAEISKRREQNPAAMFKKCGQKILL
jgi:hypothetical protein